MSRVIFTSSILYESETSHWCDFYVSHCRVLVLIEYTVYRVHPVHICSCICSIPIIYHFGCILKMFQRATICTDIIPMSLVKNIPVKLVTLVLSSKEHIRCPTGTTKEIRRKHSSRVRPSP